MQFFWWIVFNDLWFIYIFGLSWQRKIHSYSYLWEKSVCHTWKGVSLSRDVCAVRVNKIINARCHRCHLWLSQFFAPITHTITIIPKLLPRELKHMFLSKICEGVNGKSVNLHLVSVPLEIFTLHNYTFCLKFYDTISIGV